MPGIWSYFLIPNSAISGIQNRYAGIVSCVGDARMKFELRSKKAEKESWKKSYEKKLRESF